MGRQETKPLPQAVVPSSDSEALLADSRNKENTPDWDLMHEARPKPAITVVPDWLYTEEGFWSLSKAASLWWANLVCAVSHTIMMIVSIAMSASGEGGLATPTLSVYLTKLTWVDNSTDALIPSYEKTTGIALPALVILFFFLSAFAHTLVCALNFRQAFATGFIEHVFDPERSKITKWTGWYFVNIHLCQNPLRWVEYSFSASIMAIVFCISSGINHVYMLTCIFFLMWSVMIFGLFTETLCPPNDLGNDKKPQFWLRNDTNPHALWWPVLNGRIHRLMPHIAGWMPYCCVWGIVLHSFIHNISNAKDGQGPPGFVYAIVIGQVIVFSLFGITQFILLWREDGPKWFYWGEMSYQFLSLLAKTLLGGILLANVLLFRSFEDAVLDANSQM